MLLKNNCLIRENDRKSTTFPTILFANKKEENIDRSISIYLFEALFLN